MSKFKPQNPEQLQKAISEYLDNNNSQQAVARYGHIGTWDVSLITSMNNLFGDYSQFNENIENWDVSNVSTMENMFGGCSNFNQPLNKWNVSNVQNMSFMFQDCSKFNQPLNQWNTSNVVDMYEMFMNCDAFNQSLNDWNVSNVKNMHSMFNGCKKFNKPLNNWNVSNVKIMDTMFMDCNNFNQSLNNWDVSNVEEINDIFINCTSLSAPFNNWHLRIYSAEDSIPDSARNELIVGLFDDTQVTQFPSFIGRDGNVYQASDDDDYVPMEVVEDRQQRAQEIQNVAKTYSEQHLDNSNCERCLICDECLDNISGPPANSYCRKNCADVVQVHPDMPHRFHRGCILQWCNAPDVNITEQMGTNEEWGNYNRPQQGKNKCPICRIKIDCAKLKTQSKVSDALLSNATGGKKLKKRNKTTYYARHSNNKTKKHSTHLNNSKYNTRTTTHKRKTNKRKTNKRKTNKRKN